MNDFLCSGVIDGPGTHSNSAPLGASKSKILGPSPSSLSMTGPSPPLLSLHSVSGSITEIAVCVYRGISRSELMRFS